MDEDEQTLICELPTHHLLYYCIFYMLFLFLLFFVFFKGINFIRSDTYST